MIESGLVKLVQADAGVTALVGTRGGYFAELPKDYVLPSWTYQFVSGVPEVTLKTTEALTYSRYQVDCHGTVAADAIKLAKAINAVLSGFSGILTDPDSTRVQGCFRSNVIDFFDDASQSYRRMLEYDLWFKA